MKKTWLYFLLAVAVLGGCTAYRTAVFQQKYGPVQTVNRQVETSSPDAVSFYEDVQPILDRRCSVCHSCYDAPCQLKLTCFSGVERGGSKTLVYNGARLKADRPTRLHIDADTVAEWRGLGFHPVLNERIQTQEANLDNSLLNLMLQLKKEHPIPETDLLPETFDIRLDHDYICTTVEDFRVYEKKYPLWGMPYALPGLADSEVVTIVEWLRQGAKVTPQPGMSAQAQEVIGRWETFLNGESPRERLVSRYIYEHLFIGRIHFDTLPDREFYRLVRSRTPPGEAVDEIGTVRPYDDPGVDRVYYRFRKIQSTIAVKDHTVFHVSAKKMERYRELFFETDYEVGRLPSYDPETTANPFITFADLPAKSRYRFMLEDARFFIEGFIKGPVCRGQVALNVINDHFFVAFFDPEKDAVSNDTAFLAQVSDLLSLPSEKKSDMKELGGWREYSRKQEAYLKAREEFLSGLESSNRGVDLSYVWNGEHTNDNALLTVFRHFDSASVVKGFVGKMPKTGWVIDYPLFERVHYLLVAGFDVFGNLGHQLETRLYMDLLRMEGESNFLIFLPRDIRKQLWANWYEGARKNAENYLADHFSGLVWQTSIVYTTDDPKKELFQKMLAHAGPATQQEDYLNRCPAVACVDEKSSPAEQRADRGMQRIAGMRGQQVQVIPDVTFVHVLTGSGEEDLAYTIIRNKALSNNSMLFFEDRRRRPDDDSLTVVKGHVGSYPNAFSRIHVDQIDERIDQYLKIMDHIDYYNSARAFGVQRNSPDFWAESDWHYQAFLKEKPVEAGVFDMYRFHRIGEKSDAAPKW